LKEGYEMSLPRIIIVDVQHDNKRVDIDDLTDVGLGCLIYECKELLTELEDKRAELED